jgi:importin subunit beta-1
VRTQIANAIATIAKIEIPRKEWMDLIPNLSTNSNHEDTIVRQAALQTLQIICEEMSPDDLNPELKNQIILGLTNNISTNFENPDAQKCTEYAIKGLFNALPFATQNFQVVHERDYIMQKVFDALQNPNEDIRTTAMQTLVEIGRQEYESIEFYFPKICTVTALAAKSDEQTVGAQGIEFWTSLAEEELSRTKKNGHLKGYIVQCSGQLVQLLVEGTMRVSMEDEDDDGDDWGVALSSGCCLAKVALLVGNAIMEPVIKFVSENITAQNWKQRYAALLSLGAITEGPDKMQFMNVVMPGLPNLISMFNDQHAKVREALGWLMSRICEHHSDVVSGE